MAWREFHQEQLPYQHLARRVGGLASRAKQSPVEPDSWT